MGGEIAREAARRGHRVTCLARGESGEPPAEVTWVRADRTEPTAYDEVAGRDWDAVFDVSWQPDQVRSALHSLAGRTTHWVYVSSSSVYAEEGTPDTDEAAPLHDPHSGEGPVDVEVYGPAKVTCEQACRDAMGESHVLSARAGLIAGYGDRSDRFGYWPGRVARAADGEPVLTPPRDNPLQIIDVLDLATWLVDCAEARTSGAYNAIGGVSTVGAVLDACVETTGHAPRFAHATHEWLAEHGVEPWSGPGSLPLWLPQPEYAGFMTRRNAAARAVGLTCRPLGETVANALRWEQQVGLERERRAGLTPARESELLGLLID